MTRMIQTYFLLFFIYSVMGWCMEVLCILVEEKKLVNRGFLIGPYCPIYGCGAILISLLLKGFVNRPFLLFMMAILVCGILEYATSYFMEKIFHLRWWDYSNRKLNINGRICARTIIPFGILGMWITYSMNPFLLSKIALFSEKILFITCLTILIIFVLDIVISLIVVFKIKRTTQSVNSENREDNTEEITKKVKAILLSGTSFAQKRLINAYPKLKAIKIKVKEKIEHTKKEIGKQKEKLDQKVDHAKESIHKKIKGRGNE